MLRYPYTIVPLSLFSPSSLAQLPPIHGALFRATYPCHISLGSGLIWPNLRTRSTRQYVSSVGGYGRYEWPDKEGRTQARRHRDEERDEENEWLGRMRPTARPRMQGRRDCVASQATSLHGATPHEKPYRWPTSTGRKRRQAGIYPALRHSP
ncbi:hypothetical protein GGS23DRAFT_195644 [Durotheca rogersii]|uniref:uncharacterized protein n=1 Tax=Durotheca rogersii TaxID=419775 RepID=UPI0022204456|nr:uncharacterized protein GGS23DRAFT_195644 [Durotheca rogersii]KAI5867786.1 hypothetical protein GGS23DRAFT_195644 [Durotheca rogersii]